MLQLICGVDEAGRGPLAGPVFAGAVILNPNRPIIGLADSKTLCGKKRERLYKEIITKALAYSVSSSSVLEIDQINILQATLLAMYNAVMTLSIDPQLVLIDGNQSPKFPYATQTIIKGDVTVSEISAASILAKVSRDRFMTEIDKQYPEYGFIKHKGYGTKEHLMAIKKYGPTEIHRMSFAPMKYL